ncbi:hypothetical protein [Reyranella sp.]|uniref:hypothetical protein n=1 Tax=Reyranella sp. TaxID=1929291 RepID=UPI0037842D2D
MRHAVTLLWLLLLAACAAPPKPFEHDDTEAPIRQLPRDKNEVAIALPKNMPPEMGRRVAASLAMELQSYGIVAAVQPAQAPIQISSTMSTRDAGETAIEIQVDWKVDGAPNPQESTTKTRARPEDYAEASERLVSRIAYQAAPRVATMIGRPPNFKPRSPGQVAAGVTVAEEPPPDLTVPPIAGLAPTAAGATPPAPQLPGQPPPAQEAKVKVLVAPVTGAPSDGNRQLYSGMRRALGSSKIIVVDAEAPDAFIVVGAVTVTPVDERTVQLVIKWFVKDPSGKTIGDLEQANPVPAAAAKGSWAGFGDIVATAASEGVLELLEKAINRPR